MKNETSVKYFYMLPFSGETRNTPLISTVFFLIYLVGILLNSSVITVICLEVKLHKPMYLFICNLSIVDIFYTSFTAPKLLHMLLSGNHIVSIPQCYIQFHTLLSVAAAEDILLFIMAYDRYVAICLPLYYNQILTQRNCLMITIGIWAAAVLNSLIFAILGMTMSSCHSNVIHQFFCDAKALTKTTCTGTLMFFVVIGFEILIFAFIPLIWTVISYVNIFLVIIKMTSKDTRKKAFSTCSSHIIIISIYHGTSLIEYLIPSYFDVSNLAFSIIYTNIVPMINPIIYSVQNSNIQSALLGLIREIWILMNRLWTSSQVKTGNRRAITTQT